MKTMQIAIRGAALITIAILVISPMNPARGAMETEQADRFSEEELAQMLAPIALYPDSLLSQILMASTYPLEIVAAERWLRENIELKGDALRTALQEEDWDTSIKSLCQFPDVLFALSDKLDQTQKLGDAFLGQEDEVIAVVQKLRHKAYEQENLKTTQEQKVVVEREVIRIEPAAPEVIYVPVYDPYYVYGPWWYPSYPPYYWYRPAGYDYRVRYISFRPPIFLDFGWFLWAWFDWSSRRISISVDGARRFHSPLVWRTYSHPYWRHDPHHRRTLAYRDRRTSERFRQKPYRVAPRDLEPQAFPPRIPVAPYHPKVQHSQQFNLQQARPAAPSPPPVQQQISPQEARRQRVLLLQSDSADRSVPSGPDRQRRLLPWSNNRSFPGRQDW